MSVMEQDQQRRFSCALSRGVVLVGRLYVCSDKLKFRTSLMKEANIALMLKDVEYVEKKGVGGVDVVMKSGERVKFVTFAKRDKAYRTIYSRLAESNMEHLSTEKVIAPEVETPQQRPQEHGEFLKQDSMASTRDSSITTSSSETTNSNSESEEALENVTELKSSDEVSWSFPKKKADSGEENLQSDLLVPTSPSRSLALSGGEGDLKLSRSQAELKLASKAQISPNPIIIGIALLIVFFLVLLITKTRDLSNSIRYDYNALQRTVTTCDIINS
mmetsp:Transcript_7307/g.22282  ORF Transcript_7307/g.22282 Transcript_7307/m.22282 type:complete len:274 (+) Transcript_7307:49-870(+)